MSKRKNPAAVALGKRGGSAGTPAQREARIKVAIKMREKRAANRAKAKGGA